MDTDIVAQARDVYITSRKKTPSFYYPQSTENSVIAAARFAVILQVLIYEMRSSSFETTGSLHIGRLTECL